MTTKIKQPERRLHVIVSIGDAEPRIFEQSASGTEAAIERAVEAGAAWFGVAFNETLRRARQQDAEQQGQRAA